MTRRLLSGRAGVFTTTSACASGATGGSDVSDAACNNPSCPLQTG
ncbi:hypothetical protein ACFFHJ_17920 [Planotetraspora thailandica]|nr:hypothetical protein [Planotetraspora thailandica]